MYMEGECVGSDPVKAMTWFRRAADQGMIGSRTMARMYQEGLGVDKDPEEAKRLYREAGFEGLTHRYNILNR